MDAIWRMRIGATEGGEAGQDYAVAFALVFLGPILPSNGGFFSEVSIRPKATPAPVLRRPKRETPTPLRRIPPGKRLNF
jgi:hypothetical protein